MEWLLLAGALSFIASVIGVFNHLMGKKGRPECPRCGCRNWWYSNTRRHWICEHCMYHRKEEGAETDAP